MLALYRQITQSRQPRVSPALYKAIRCQVLALILVFLIGQTQVLPPLDILALAALQGICASFFSLTYKAERWWIPLHLVFLPCVVMASQLQLPANAYGAVFLLLLCIYWTTFRTRVPLFLSNRASVHRLAARFSQHKNLQVLDVGSGTGSFVLRLASLRPDWQVSGSELAPIPYLISRWRAHRQHNAALYRRDFWNQSFATYGLVYAFLSPAPMAELWRKARQEMPPGSMLVSNSFPIPDLAPTLVISVGDRRQTQLFCYRIPEKRSVTQILRA